MSLDKFYTIDSVAAVCVSKALEFCRTPLAYTKFVEPSAGGGAFIRALQGHGISPVAYDLEPGCDGIIRGDWLKAHTRPGGHRTPPYNTIVIGNPPFGKRAHTAIQFFNIAALQANTIAFIVPLQFRKYSVQNKLNVEFALVHDEALPRQSFTVDGKPKSLNTCFQVWIRRPVEWTDLRLKSKPPISHPDFQMWQYNNTPKALKVFSEVFDFAVPRQGHYDYSRKETDPLKCERTIQWILFKARTPVALERLRSIDFHALSQKNTITPGFGKADVVAEYRRRFDCIS